MENKNVDERSKIVEFFRDSTVFLTGGTGFFGKVIVNKLFSTCQVSCIYLLVRKKASKCSSERLQKLLRDPVFVQLGNKIPDLANRIKLVEGDCSLENLGLSASNEKTLRESVNFIIHCVASMNMLGSCKTAIEINIRGTFQLANLAKKITNLKAFVYVSSLAAVYERDEVDEKLYESHLEYEDMLNLLKLDKVLPIDKQDRKRIIGNKLTIYALTKTAAENIFIREQIQAPVVIFRFCIAFPCLKEPFAGWIDEFYGPNGAYALPLLNIVPAMYFENSIRCDCAPADIIANALIALTQYSYNEFQKNKDEGTKITPFVCNFSNTNHKNELNFNKLESFMKREFNFSTRIYSNKFIFILRSVMFGFIPALIIDFFLLLFGEKCRVFRAYRSMIKLNLDLVAINFSSRVNCNNVEKCWQNLNSIDRKLFSFDLNEVVWDEYLPLFASSLREYLRTLFKNHRMIALAAFWIPKVRLAFEVLYCALGLYCVYLITLWLIHL